MRKLGHLVALAYSSGINSPALSTLLQKGSQTAVRKSPRCLHSELGRCPLTQSKGIQVGTGSVLCFPAKKEEHVQALHNLPWAFHMTGHPALSSPRLGQPRTLGSVYWSLSRVNEPAEFRAMTSHSEATVRIQSFIMWAAGLLD